MKTFLTVALITAAPYVGNQCSFILKGAYSNPTSFVGNFDTQIVKPRLSSGLSLSKIDQECAALRTTAIHGHVKGLGERSSEVELGVADMESQVLHGKTIEGLEPQPEQKDDFPPSPSDHQSILVSLSSQCLSCERPRLKRIKYYGPSDKPLGKFLKDSLFNAVSYFSPTHLVNLLVPKSNGNFLPKCDVGTM
jgi:hypothetical protein